MIGRRRGNPARSVEPMRALVTGGGGFLGQYIVEQLLARGDSVRSFCRQKYPALDDQGVEQVQGDLQDARAVSAACRDREVVFHVAAVAGIWGPREKFFGINTLGTQHVVNGCRQHGVPRLVYCSSPSVTFTAIDQCGVDETTPYATNWLCHYPHSKAVAEQLVLEANDGVDLRTCALRPHLIWGPRDQHLIPRLLARARSGQLRQVGDGRNLIDTIYVENAAEAHLRAADALGPGSPVAGQAYFISQGQPVNCWDWINEILRIHHLSAVRKRISFAAAWCVGRLLEGIHTVCGWDSEPRMTRFLAAQLAKSHYFTIRKAQADFGFAPTISLDQGMRRLANSRATG